MNPLKVGTSGPEVTELEQKLIKAGFLANNSDTSGIYTESIEKAVKAFQTERKLHVDGICGNQTWRALQEAQWKFGDRNIYLTSPMMYGDDVGTLQKNLGQLGFNAGKEDNIFGPETEQALLEFQNNNHLTTDKICGPKTLQTLKQISHRAKGENVASVRDREKLRSTIAFQKIFIAHLTLDEEIPQLNQLFTNIEEKLTDFEILHRKNHDPSTLATQASEFGADVCLALRFSQSLEFHADYFATKTYESAGGKHLATLLAANIPPILFESNYEQIEPQGKRSQILQETKMWTVLCTLGPPNLIIEKENALSKAFSKTLKLWAKNT